jgi:hypothetical protein
MAGRVLLLLLSPPLLGLLTGSQPAQAQPQAEHAVRHHVPRLVDDGAHGLKVSLLATLAFMVVLAVAMYCGKRKPSKWVLEQQELELQSLLGLGPSGDSEGGVPASSWSSAGTSGAGAAGSGGASYMRYMRSRAGANAESGVASSGAEVDTGSPYEFRMAAGAAPPAPPPPPPTLAGVHQAGRYKRPAVPGRTMPAPLPAPSTPPPQPRPKPKPKLVGRPYGDVVISEL